MKNDYRTIKGEMTTEYQTFHDGCGGTIWFDPGQSRLSIVMGNHQYRCDKCYKTWIFKRKCNETNN